MANKKISDLAAATTPLSGAEKLELEGSDGNSGRCTTQDVADLAKATLSVQTVISAGTVTPVASNDKVVISAQAAALTIANPSGTAAEGQGFVIALKDDGTSRAISFGTSYRAMGASLPTATVAGKWAYLPVQYNATDSKWDVFAASKQA